MTFDDELAAELEALAAVDRLRETVAWSGADRTRPTAPTGRPMLSFCSNDYLGLASHPLLGEADARAAAHGGYGAGASRLLAGESPIHRDLEDTLARLVDRPATLLFPSGYQANLGVLTALAGPDDLIASDAANHASIVDGCRLSRARIAVFPHGDAQAAARALAAPGPFRRRLLITESLFSMDGDRAPLPALADAAARYGAVLIVDEAHALGVAGPAGRGLCAAAGVRPDVLVGTLGKAFGVAGGFAAGSARLRQLLLNRARTFIYTTAPPPPLAAAARAAVELALGPEGEARRARAARHAARLRAALGSACPPVTDLILPLLIGAERDALALSQGLFERGILIPAVRPPTVPAGTARLRITVSAAHDDADVDALVGALEALGALPRSAVA